jgi:hypothetical protein
MVTGLLYYCDTAGCIGFSGDAVLSAYFRTLFEEAFWPQMGNGFPPRPMVQTRSVPYAGKI